MSEAEKSENVFNAGEPLAGRPWPFLVKRVLRSRDPSDARRAAWQFCQSFSGHAGVALACDGVATPANVYEHMTHVFRADEWKLAKVVVHGNVLPGRVVQVLAVSVFSQDHSDLADQFVGEPLAGLLEFLKGESFEPTEFCLWETMATTAWAHPTGSHPPLSSRLVVTSPPCPSSAPGAASTPALTLPTEASNSCS